MSVRHGGLADEQHHYFLSNIIIIIKITIIILNVKIFVIRCLNLPVVVQKLVSLVFVHIHLFQSKIRPKSNKDLN